ncbi:hypothetical protein EMIHUDRAFT_222316 [Emiliania huxleyi CCMP1516]|uniref:THUMP domain-containing protein n=2 Tax=Emiliania huxleyi TaxID=2903 RepID=A0A0D3KYS4_EMIH1|nr:hypothetical protein EMIHUDRAFT_222316 [Emiliania huxleyi CCMP1516]EOD40909.1 hypothetical protein EMIHUDRAFT_222316 [Emiliania huxleyi CCMP1516]|eukprot:XP_005793338.1 hypothetical protein EMIHUDRAFT_222316 [Emiliania huxleyi CCMP1516]
MAHALDGGEAKNTGIGRSNYSSMEPTADDPSVQYMLTTNNVPHRQCATELVAFLPKPLAASVRHGKASSRGVTCDAPASAAPTLAALTLPERIYAVVCCLPATSLPDDEAAVLPALRTLVAEAPGWPAALAAHCQLHPGLSSLSFAVVATRRGRRFKQSVGSLQLGTELGGALHTYFGWRVDLTAPSLEVTVSLNDEGLHVSLALLRRLDSIECRTRGGLDPHVAWAMVRSLGELPPGGLVCDPMCGKASLLLEALDAHPLCVAAGFDLADAQLEAAIANHTAVPPRIAARLSLMRGDASQLPFAAGACAAILCDLPFECEGRFGYKLDTSRGGTLGACIKEMVRVLRPGGRAVLLMGDERMPPLREALADAGLRAMCERPCPLGFTQATIVVTEKPAGASEAIDDSGTGEEPQQRHAPAGEGGAGGSETSTPAVSVGALPWEGTGRRAEWTVLRKEKRAPMVPWFVAPSKGVVEESV